MLNNYRVPVLEKTIEVLDHLQKHPGATLPSLVSDLGIPKTTLYRILQTLRAHQLIGNLEGDGEYALGPALVRLASGVPLVLNLPLQARPAMERLSASLQETCKLTVRDRSDALVLSVQHSPRQFGISALVGRRLPLHAGAASKILMAYMPEDEREALLTSPLARYTDSTIIDPVELGRSLQTVREQGWAEDRGEYADGVRAYAAPVRDAHGQVVAALSVPFVDARGTDGRVEVREGVIEAAAEVSTLLGFV